MQTKRKTLFHSSILFSFLFCTVTLVITGNQAFSQSSGSEKPKPAQSESSPDQLPSGKWGVSFMPYMKSGYQALPAFVTAVCQETAHGVRANRVSLKNNTNKLAVGVKLQWHLTNEQDQETILQTGETPLIAISGGVKAGECTSLDFPVVSFAQICKPLIKNGSLNGNFNVDITVSEILFDDSTTWPETEK